LAQLMRTSNPALNEQAFQGAGVATGEAMTLQGTVNKTGVLLLCAIATAAYTWNVFNRTQQPDSVMGLAIVGGISAMFEMRFHGIAIQAVSLTFGTLVVLLLAYRSGLIPVTQKFKMGVVAATGGIALFYLLSIVLGFFGIHFTTINGSGPIGIGFSVVVVIVASLNLVLDFDFIESGVRAGAPKYMEWYAAFGLMVTLIWLYFEILRLLSKLRSRN